MAVIAWNVCCLTVKVTVAVGLQCTVQCHSRSADLRTKLDPRNAHLMLEWLSMVAPPVDRVNPKVMGVPWERVHQCPISEMCSTPWTKGHSFCGSRIISCLVKMHEVVRIVGGHCMKCLLPDHQNDFCCWFQCHSGSANLRTKLDPQNTF